jgi:peptidoglycan/xylan/chitin deacetylase (PgdA/CDA1 family)
MCSLRNLGGVLMKSNNLKIYTIILIVYLLVNILIIPKAMAESLNNEQISDQNNKVIYLTFDDGPSVLTDEVLNILKKYDVKATFFLIGNQIKGQEKVVKRIHEEGHAIGLHTYSHIYKKIYSNRNTFISEMLKTQTIINSITGETPTIIRFPWGSRNRLTKIFLEDLHKHNFKVYDWNVDMTDGKNCKAPLNRLFREATKVPQCQEPLILLMHCDYIHKNTCKVLPQVIKFYKDKGYEFKVIEDSTPEYYVPLKK